MKNLLLSLVLFVISQVSSAVECKSGTTVRKVDIVYETEGKKVPCSVKYTKEDGIDKILFSAKAEEGYCEKKSEAFQQKLKTMGWDCAAN